jgi:hypothetical protein
LATKFQEIKTPNLNNSKNEKDLTNKPDSQTSFDKVSNPKKKTCDGNPNVFYSKIINKNLGQNSQFICLNCCLNGMDPGVKIIQRITKLTIVRPKGDHKNQVCTIPILNKFIDNNKFLNLKGLLFFPF